jgi:hypothetical protein
MESDGEYMRMNAVKSYFPIAAVVLLCSAFMWQSSPGPYQGTWVDHGGSITSGGTSQALIVANSRRNRVIVENPCTTTSQGIGATESLFINFTSAASTSNGKSIELAACGSFDSGPGPVSTEAITVNAVTTGHQYMAKEM